jgi:RHS repeat-associated protein
LVAESNYTFDAAGRLTDIVHEQNAAILAEFNLEYDPGDRITQFTTPDGVSNFTYDDTDQLVDADHSYQDRENFTYDDNGNRTNTGYVTGDNNQLLSDGKFNYEYDGEGNRVKRTEIATGEVTEYQWDHRNRLVAAVTKSSNGDVIANSEYTYDVNNNRIAKSVDADGAGAGEAVVERYVLDGDHIALTFDGEANQTERFLHGTQIDQVLAQENANGEVLWALTDHQNSVRVVLDGDGKIVNQISYDSFGQITNETHSDVDFRFGYTGRELDAETGLYYNRARYYDPESGEFVSEDPIGFAAGDSNLSRYVGNNPLFYLDPTGLCSVGSSGSPEFFGPAFGPDSSPGSDIGSGLDFFGLGDFAGFAPGGSGFGFGGFGGFGVTPFPGDNTFKVAGALESQSQLLDHGPVRNDNNGDSYPDYYEPKLIDGFGAAAGLGIGWSIYKTHSSQTDDGSKFTTDVKDIWEGFKNWFTKGDKSDELGSNSINGGVDGDLGISSNVEKFPRPDDFLKGDTFSFPGGDFSGLSKPIPDFNDDFSDLFIGVLESSDGLTPAQRARIKNIENILRDHAKPHDFEGVRQELSGVDTGYDHITEMQDSMRGLENNIKSIENSLKNPNLDSNVRQSLEKTRKNAQDTVDEMRRTLNGQ